MKPEGYEHQTRKPVHISARQTREGTVVEVTGPVTSTFMPNELQGATGVHIRTESDELCPTWVGSLSGLQELRLDYLGYAELIPRLFTPPGLRRLTLRGAGIRELHPAGIREMRDLRILDLQRTLLRDLPPGLKTLTGLEELVLDYPITEVPSWIGELVRLRRLILAGTTISSLPKEISTLAALEELDASRTQLTKLPKEIELLSCLTRLVLTDSKVTALPPGIGQLHRLRYIELQGCPLSSLPSEVGQLRDLQYLDLRGCPLRQLPPEMGRLNDKIDLRLAHNQLNEPLPALVSSGTQALLSYLRSLEEEGTPRYEAKLLLLGEGNVGKSSLIAALRGQPFVENRPTTHGIELHNLDLPHPKIDQQIHLTAWDFGGQEVYRISHQFFYSPRSLYLLVWRPREGQEENAIESWIRRVKLRIGGAGKIIIVSTYGSEGRGPELDFPYLKQKFGDILVDSLAVDNENGLGIEQLTQVIAKHAATLPQMGELFNGAWIAATENILEKAKASPYITRSELELICTHQGLGGIETKTLMKLLHDLGHLIHFDEDEGLRDLVVLQPEWLTKAISLVLEDQVTRDADGVLRYDRLGDLWQKNSDNLYSRDYHPYFLRLMEKFDVSYRLPEEPATLVGQLVPYKRPVLPWTATTPTPQNIRTLTLLCRMSEPPPGLVAWLTVRNHRFWTGKHWRRGVFLEHADHAAQGLFELLTDVELRLIVRAPSPDVFFGLLCDSVEYLIEQRWTGLSHEFFVPCPQRLGATSCTGLFSYPSLRRFRELGKSHIDCHTCTQQQDVGRLLTGFEMTTSQLDKDLDRIARDVQRVKEDQLEIATIAAESAAHLRAAIKILGEEVTDCPRMFTLEQLSARRGLPWKERFKLTLCCEYPGSEHPFQQGTYEFSRPKSWFREILPYAVFISRLLKIAIPVAGSAVYDLLSNPDSQWLDRQFKIIQSVAEQVPYSVDKEPTRLRTRNRLTATQGAGLRAYRHLLLDIDPARSFGELQRVVTISGDILWVCPDHYRRYEPGLPILSDYY